MIPWKVFCGILVAGLLGASQALAVPTFDMTVRLLGRPLGSGPGGEFLFEVTGSTVPGFEAGDQIKTFCLERWERVQITDPPTSYEVTINDDNRALWGGMGLLGDPLDPKTAYLYSSYCSGTLDGWTNDKDSADALQYAIYSIENEMTLDLLISPAALLKASGFLAAATGAHWTDTGNVRVMNLYYGYPGYGYCGSPYYSSAQDQLILLPPPIPAPPAVVLGLIGLGLIVQTNVRRFFR